MKKTYELVNQSIIKNLAEEISGDNELFNPVITIARDPGSGGNPIAKLVAKKLDYTFYDDALIEAIAKSAKRRTRIIKNIDEKTRNIIQDLVHNLLNPDYVSESTYINHLTKVVLSIAAEGKAVLLGRGTNLIVPNSRSLDVLITSSKKIRIARAVKYEGHTVAKAREIIDKYSKERKDFVSQYFGKGYHNPVHYDLIINTHFFDINQAAELIIAAFKIKFAKLFSQ